MIESKQAVSGEELRTTSRGPRLQSVDLIRGLAMILMAIDHVRVYSGLPAGGPSPGIFFTRWVTHFCAPAFIFFAGTSAYLYGQRHAGLSKFLLTRGIWLVLLELTFFRWAWTFNWDFADYEMAGVIWVIGWSMIVLAGLVKMPLPITAALGLAIVGGHNLMDPHMTQALSQINESSLSGLWKILYFGFFGGPIRFGPKGPNLIVLYSLVPWVGVMAAGYAFGKVVSLKPTSRNVNCLAIGVAATLLFVALRWTNVYGDPQPWTGATTGPKTLSSLPSLMSFLNCSKYPASLQFLLMTLGPTIAAIPLLELLRGPVARFISVFGRVPFFFYALHIPLIHVLAIAVSYIRTGAIDPWLFANHPMGNPPAPTGYVWNLAWLYLVWAIAIAVLYPCCRWFAGIRARRSDWWLRYL